MSLPARQQRALLDIGQAIEARDPRLAAMFRIFTRLHASDAVPRHERLVRGERPARQQQPWRGLFYPATNQGGTARAATSAVGSFALLACLMAVVVVSIVVGLSTPGCPQPAHPRQATSHQAATCKVPALPSK